jgi:hypothetical protein
MSNLRRQGVFVLYAEATYHDVLLSSIFNPLRGCNSDKAQYSNTQVLHHPSCPKSSTSRSTSTKRLMSTPNPLGGCNSPWAFRKDCLVRVQSGTLRLSTRLWPRRKQRPVRNWCYIRPENRTSCMNCDFALVGIEYSTPVPGTGKKRRYF